ncbi:piggyBac transposable element-derived protein 4-like [Vespula squamosa]|uniref:PiggyBac transposable element-derived protein 4-like n=1 Tax=Vespula squamosa TaxID=30214 RepID=A0ABD2A673_VESSQ
MNKLKVRRKYSTEEIESDYSCDTDGKEESTLNARRGQKRRRFLSKNSTIGCFKEVSGPTAYAKRNIIFSKAKTAFFLIIDNIIIEYIKKYIEAEALRVLETK